MRRNRPPRREIPSGLREPRASAPGQQRPNQQHGSAQPADERAVGLVLHDLPAPHAKCRAADALDFCAEIEQQPRHHLHVGDARHICQHALLGRQQACGEQRKRRVFVAFHVNGPR